MTAHEQWVHDEAARIFRENGSLEPTWENAALVELNCVGRRAHGYMDAVGTPPPAGIEKEVAAVYWQHVTTNPPLPPAEQTERERMLSAIHRFEEEMGFASQR